jgi:hypothetical protein
MASVRFLQLHKFTWMVAVLATGVLTWANSVPRSVDQVRLVHGSTLYTLGWPSSMVNGVLHLWQVKDADSPLFTSVEQWSIAGYAMNGLVALAIVAACAATTELLLRQWRAASKP